MCLNINGTIKIQPRCQGSPLRVGENPGNEVDKMILWLQQLILADQRQKPRNKLGKTFLFYRFFSKTVPFSRLLRQNVDPFPDQIGRKTTPMWRYLSV